MNRTYELHNPTQLLVMWPVVTSKTRKLSIKMIADTPVPLQWHILGREEELVWVIFLEASKKMSEINIISLPFCSNNLMSVKSFFKKRNMFCFKVKHLNEFSHISASSFPFKNWHCLGSCDQSWVKSKMHTLYYSKQFSRLSKELILGYMCSIHLMVYEILSCYLPDSFRLYITCCYILFYE